MELYNDKEVFKSLCAAASESLQIPEYAIEKDFYAMLILEAATRPNQSVVFKGGTSLSKGYGLLKRFSEDIDLCIEIPNGQTIEKSEQLLKLISSSDINENVKKLEFVKETKGEDKLAPTKPSSLYYCFNYLLTNWNSAANKSSNYIKVESTILSKPYPTEQKVIHSYVFQYLRSLGAEGESLINKYGLHEFSVRTQKPERTFIDKTFAIADYYLENKTNRNSRHLYDLDRLLASDLVDLNDPKLHDLAKKVYEERKTMDRAYSARKGIILNRLLGVLISDSIYKDDYERITKKLFFGDEKVSYEQAIASLQKIVDSNLFEFAQ